MDINNRKHEPANDHEDDLFSAEVDTYIDEETDILAALQRRRSARSDLAAETDRFLRRHSVGLLSSPAPTPDNNNPYYSHHQDPTPKIDASSYDSSAQPRRGSADSIPPGRPPNLWPPPSSHLSSSSGHVQTPPHSLISASPLVAPSTITNPTFNSTNKNNPPHDFLLGRDFDREVNSFRISDPAAAMCPPQPSSSASPPEKQPLTDYGFQKPSPPSLHLRHNPVLFPLNQRSAAPSMRHPAVSSAAADLEQIRRDKEALQRFASEAAAYLDEIYRDDTTFLVDDGVDTTSAAAAADHSRKHGNNSSEDFRRRRRIELDKARLERFSREAEALIDRAYAEDPADMIEEEALSPSVLPRELARNHRLHSDSFKENNNDTSAFAEFQTANRMSRAKSIVLEDKRILQQFHNEAMSFLDAVVPIAEETPASAGNSSRASARIQRDKKQLEQYYREAMAFLDRAERGEGIVEERELENGALDRVRLKLYAKEAMSFLESAFAKESDDHVDDGDMSSPPTSTNRRGKLGGPTRELSIEQREAEIEARAARVAAAREAMLTAEHPSAPSGDSQVPREHINAGARFPASVQDDTDEEQRQIAADRAAMERYYQQDNFGEDNIIEETLSDTTSGGTGRPLFARRAIPSTETETGDEDWGDDDASTDREYEDTFDASVLANVDPVLSHHAHVSGRSVPDSSSFDLIIADPSINAPGDHIAADIELDDDDIADDERDDLEESFRRASNDPGLDTSGRVDPPASYLQDDRDHQNYRATANTMQSHGYEGQIHSDSKRVAAANVEYEGLNFGDRGMPTARVSPNQVPVNSSQAADNSRNTGNLLPADQTTSAGPLASVGVLPRNEVIAFKSNQFTQAEPEPSSELVKEKPAVHSANYVHQSSVDDSRMSLPLSTSSQIDEDVLVELLLEGKDASGATSEWSEIPLERSFYRQLPRGATIKIRSRSSRSSAGVALSDSTTAPKSATSRWIGPNALEYDRIEKEREVVLSALEEVVNERSRMAAQISELKSMISQAVGGAHPTSNGAVVSANEGGDIDIANELKAAHSEIASLIQESEATMNVLEGLLADSKRRVVELEERVLSLEKEANILREQHGKTLLYRDDDAATIKTLQAEVDRLKKQMESYQNKKQSIDFEGGGSSSHLWSLLSSARAEVEEVRQQRDRAERRVAELQAASKTPGPSKSPDEIAVQTKKEVDSAVAAAEARKDDTIRNLREELEQNSTAQRLEIDAVTRKMNQLMIDLASRNAQVENLENRLHRSEIDADTLRASLRESEGTSEELRATIAASRENVKGQEIQFLQAQVSELRDESATKENAYQIQLENAMKLLGAAESKVLERERELQEAEVAAAKALEGERRARKVLEAEKHALEAEARAWQNLASGDDGSNASEGKSSFDKSKGRLGNSGASANVSPSSDSGGASELAQSSSKRGILKGSSKVHISKKKAGRSHTTSATPGDDASDVKKKGQHRLRLFG